MKSPFRTILANHRLPQRRITICSDLTDHRITGILRGFACIGFAALALYLAEGMAGLPVFSPAGPGGVAQLVGPTGGFLLAYPIVAGMAGWIMENGRRTLARQRHRLAIRRCDGWAIDERMPQRQWREG